MGKIVLFLLVLADIGLLWMFLAAGISGFAIGILICVLFNVAALMSWRLFAREI